MRDMKTLPVKKLNLDIENFKAYKNIIIIII